jgi:hypothetical protein
VRLNIEFGGCLNFQSPLSLSTDDCDFLQDSPTPAALRSGYHTLCVSSTNDYILFNPSQLTCTTLVRFAGGQNLGEFDLEA